jgi:hypothetical protein
MKLEKLFEQHKHTEFNTVAHLSMIAARANKFKNIKNLTYGPGTVVESIDLSECTDEESARRMAELDRRISETIAKFHADMANESVSK